jgi:hypothetical protein
VLCYLSLVVYTSRELLALGIDLYVGGETYLYEYTPMCTPLPSRPQCTEDIQAAYIQTYQIGIPVTVANSAFLICAAVHGFFTGAKQIATLSGAILASVVCGQPLLTCT